MNTETKPASIRIKWVLFAVSALGCVAWGVVRYWALVSSPQVRFGILVGGYTLPDRRAEAVIAASSDRTPAEVIQRARSGEISAAFYTLGPDRCRVIITESAPIPGEQTSDLVRVDGAWQVTRFSWKSTGGWADAPEPKPVETSTPPISVPPLDIQKMVRDSVPFSR